MYYITKDKAGLYCITRTPLDGDKILSRHETRDQAITRFYEMN